MKTLKSFVFIIDSICFVAKISWLYRLWLYGLLVGTLMNMILVPFISIAVQCYVCRIASITIPLTCES